MSRFRVRRGTIWSIPDTKVNDLYFSLNASQIYERQAWKVSSLLSSLTNGMSLAISRRVSLLTINLWPRGLAITQPRRKSRRKSTSLTWLTACLRRHCRSKDRRDATALPCITNLTANSRITRQLRHEYYYIQNHGYHCSQRADNRRHGSTRQWFQLAGILRRHVIYI